MSIYDKIPSSHEIDPVTNDTIIRNARVNPMTGIYIDNDGNTAHGNSVDGYCYYDSNGASIHREIAEPFKLAGVGFVINQDPLHIRAKE